MEKKTFITSTTNFLTLPKEKACLQIHVVQEVNKVARVLSLHSTNPVEQKRDSMLDTHFQSSGDHNMTEHPVDYKVKHA